jgi:hypothetical protein
MEGHFDLDARLSHSRIRYALLQHGHARRSFIAADDGSSQAGAMREGAQLAVQGALDSARKRVGTLLQTLCRSFEVQVAEATSSAQPAEDKFKGYLKFLAFLTAQLSDPDLYDASKDAGLQEWLVGERRAAGGAAERPAHCTALPCRAPPPGCAAEAAAPAVIRESDATVRRRIRCRARPQPSRTAGRPAAARPRPRQRRQPAQRHQPVQRHRWAAPASTACPLTCAAPSRAARRRRRQQARRAGSRRSRPAPPPRPPRPPRPSPWQATRTSC